MRKYSKQRDFIYATLASRNDHPTAETVYLRVREELPNISLATVYRNLSLLAEIGKIKKISFGEGADRFDGNTAVHNHFVCRRCGEIFDIQSTPIHSVTDLEGKPFKGAIEKQSTSFYGICPRCLEDEAEETPRFA